MRDTAEIQFKVEILYGGRDAASFVSGANNDGE
jgi:hypothetical protein